MLHDQSDLRSVYVVLKKIETVFWLPISTWIVCAMSPPGQETRNGTVCSVLVNLFFMATMTMMMTVKGIREDMAVRDKSRKTRFDWMMHFKARA